MDIKIKRIPNWWMGILFLIGLIDAFFSEEAEVYIIFCLGGFFISSIGFFIGAIGGADVKLIGIMAGWLRDWSIWFCVFIALMVAACIGLVQMIYQRNFCSRMITTYQFIIHLLQGRTKAWRNGLPGAKPISFALCILVGYWIMKYVL
ncbi:hypothetical protein NDGK_00092 [Clostridiales bacterium CHKCI001]|nr:hypothetical protein NDGK_00092 [Clostridiales bacterium CHKCI001]